MLVLYRTDTGQCLGAAAVMAGGEVELEPDDVFPERVLPNFGFTEEEFPLAKVISVPYDRDLSFFTRKYKVVGEQIVRCE